MWPARRILLMSWPRNSRVMRPRPGRRHLAAGQARQADVGNQQVQASTFFDDLQAQGAVAGLLADIAQVFQGIGHQHAHGRLVVDHQNRFSGFGRPCAQSRKPSTGPAPCPARGFGGEEWIEDARQNSCAQSRRASAGAQPRLRAHFGRSCRPDSARGRRPSTTRPSRFFRPSCAMWRSRANAALEVIVMLCLHGDDRWAKFSQSAWAAPAVKCRNAG